MSKKIVLIGTGMIGMSFIYSALQSDLASEYILIDIFTEYAEGNKLDVEDILPYNTKNISIKVGDYSDCSDANIIVICAGRPQKQGETRLEMIQDNAKIIKSIGVKVKDSGFSGISIIASNPVDILTFIYQQEYNFPKEKVIGSGCILDSNRLKVEIAKELNIFPHEVEAYVLGEHGDSSVMQFSNIKINGKKYDDFSEEKKVEIGNKVRNKAYKIIEAKKATYFGIGVALKKLCEDIIFDKKEIVSVGHFFEKDNKKLYISSPCIIGKKGIEEILNLDLSKKEQEEFKNSVGKIYKALKEY
ncbi:L-lactate dehydrogenase [Candidatus Gracilibacteria bacterium]|nr:MAG: L-lactate dehydrogenase [Candidatus Gracilibacteria bacterium]PIE85032.1 MAG: L-lactate dehydrogenase [Candidatus Gracilibacteria bacterium]